MYTIYLGHSNLNNIKGLGILSREATLPLTFWAPVSESTLREKNLLLLEQIFPLTLLHSERPKLHTILAFLSAVGLRVDSF